MGDEEQLTNTVMEGEPEHGGEAASDHTPALLDHSIHLLTGQGDCSCGCGCCGCSGSGCSGCCFSHVASSCN